MQTPTTLRRMIDACIRAITPDRLPAIALAFSLAVTGFIWYLSRANVQSTIHAQFESDVTRIAGMTQRQMLAQQTILRGAVALFTSSSTVSRKDWHRYVKQLDLQHRFPGLQLVGFAFQVQPAELPGHVAAMRRQGYTSYNVWPVSRRREYVANAYIEPFAGHNRRTLGYDMLSDPTLRAALEKARDSGKETASSLPVRFRKSRPDPELSFLVYAPVYAAREAPLTLAKRRSTLRGYAFGAIDAAEVVRTILHDWPTGISCAIYDGAQATAQPVSAEVTAFAATREGEIAGHPWTLRCQRTPAARVIDTSRPEIALWAGIPISLLLFVIFRTQSTLRRRANALASEMTATLRHDIEESRRRDSKLRQAQKLEAIGTLARGIANTLNVIFCEIIQRCKLRANESLSEDRLRGHLDDIASAGLHGRSLLERLLAFSHIDPASRVPLHLQSIVMEALDLISKSLPDGVRLGCELHASDSAVLADPTRIHQVLVNLCTNALEAMKSGGVLSVYLDLVTLEEACSFATAALSPGDYVRLRVRDTGVGISPEAIELVFDPFFTTKQLGDGTGLGLSLVYAIVSDLHGAVDLQSEPDRGCTVTVLLPSYGRISQDS
jgi:signal transduction histidine kinase